MYLRHRPFCTGVLQGYCYVLGHACTNLSPTTGFRNDGCLITSEQRRVVLIFCAAAILILLIKSNDADRKTDRQKTSPLGVLRSRYGVKNNYKMKENKVRRTGWPSDRSTPFNPFLWNLRFKKFATSLWNYGGAACYCNIMSSKPCHSKIGMKNSSSIRRYTVPASQYNRQRRKF